jgi:hypothetical protein
MNNHNGVDFKCMQKVRQCRLILKRDKRDDLSNTIKMTSYSCPQSKLVFVNRPTTVLGNWAARKRARPRIVKLAKLKILTRPQMHVL